MTDQPFLCAIDAQISPRAVGGTETHVPLQLDALARHSSERFLVLGLKGRGQELLPYLGDNMELREYPHPYSWFRPGAPDRFAPAPAWRRAIKAAGPLKGPVVELMRLRGDKAGPMWPSAVENDRFLGQSNVRVVHFPYPQYFETSLPFVYEPWGLPHRHFPEMFRPGEPEWMEALFRQGCTRASVVVAATRWIKADIVRCYGVAADKILVLPRMPVFDRPEETATGADGLGQLPELFALFPSATWPHKNHLGLLRGLARLRDDYGLRLEVICTGKTNTPIYAQIKAEIERNGLAEQVRFLGPVPRAELDQLFRAARFLVHPSKFEGFGLPLAEALHAGLPVLASRSACIPEVLGDAALYFDADDPLSMANAFKQVLENPKLLDDLRRRGQQRLNAFPSHEQLAERFVAIYKRAGGLAESRAERQALEEMIG